MRRRDVLLGTAAVSAAALAKGTALAPRYQVLIVLAGGVDSVLTVDPKDVSRVRGKIDTGYTAAERIQGKRRLFGPLMGPLARHDERLALVHGVRMDTVSHETAMNRIDFHWQDRRPLGLALGRELLGTAPLPHLALCQWPMAQSPAADVYSPTLRNLGKLHPRPAWRAAVEAHQQAELEARLAEDPEALARHTADLRSAAVLEQLLTTAPRTSPFKDPQLGNRLHLALHALRTNAARFITVTLDMLWFDSHTDNLNLQRKRIPPAYADLATFLDLLVQTRNAHGRLIDQTTVVIGSELGRYPKLNAVQGKDHWPENSWMLLGRGIRGGVTLGQTSESLVGARVDFRSGRTDSQQARPVFINSIFATLAQLTGGDPKASGYAPDDALTGILA